MSREEQLFAEIDALRGSLRESKSENRALRNVISKQRRDIENCPACRINHQHELCPPRQE